ncbi:MAG: hypothetical protein ACREDF_09515 [Thermoplasmata archaeon]
MVEEEDAARKQQQERFQQFLKCLDSLQKSVAKLSESVQKQASITEALFDAITRKDDGLISALDDTIETNETLQAEMNALRQDFPKFLRAMQAGPLYRRPGT